MNRGPGCNFKNVFVFVLLLRNFHYIMVSWDVSPSTFRKSSQHRFSWWASCQIRKIVHALRMLRMFPLPYIYRKPQAKWSQHALQHICNDYLASSPWLAAARREPSLCHYMVSLGHNELIWGRYGHTCSMCIRHWPKFVLNPLKNTTTLQLNHVLLVAATWYALTLYMLSFSEEP